MLYRIGRFELVLPPSHLLGAYQSRYKLYDWVLGEIARLVAERSSDATAVDVGANVGDTAALLCRHLDMPVLCIEGHPVFANYLRRNLANLPRCIDIAECFVGAVAGTVSLGQIQTAGGTASLTPAADVRIGKVPLRPLREILREYPRFDQFRLLKIDTDGSDFDIILASLDLLQLRLPVLYFEYDPSFRADGIAAAERAIAALSAIGYQTFVVYDNYGNLLEVVRREPGRRFRELTAYLMSHVLFGREIYYFDVCALGAADASLAVELEAVQTRLIDKHLRRVS